MEFQVHPFNTLKSYFCVDIMAIYKGKWIFCKQKNKATWENPGGHIENGETPLEAAKRELYEESGAIDFDIEPLCDYYVDVEVNGKKYCGNGQVYFAVVHTMGELPKDSEMGTVDFFDSLPNELTWPMLRDFYPLALERKKQYAV